MNDYSVGPGMRVTLHFALRLADGSEIDSTFGKEPAVFVYGDGNLLPGFEQSINGLKPGENRTANLGPEQGFGQKNPQNIQTFKEEVFSDMELAEGLVVSFADAGQSELPGVVQSVEDGVVTVDFNHPLAGEDLQFEVEIHKVEPENLH